VICNLRRQRQWHPGIASAVRCIKQKQNAAAADRSATNHDDDGNLATVDTIMVRCAQRNNGIDWQRDQKRQGAVVRSGTKPQTRYGYESSGAESHVPVVPYMYAQMSLPDNGLACAVLGGLLITYMYVPSD